MGFKFIITGEIPSITEIDGMDQLEYTIRNNKFKSHIY